MRDVLKLLAITMAVLFALGVVLAVGDLFIFGSSGPPFGESPSALRGDVAGARREAGPPAGTNEATNPERTLAK